MTGGSFSSSSLIIQNITLIYDTLTPFTPYPCIMNIVEAMYNVGFTSWVDR